MCGFCHFVGLKVVKEVMGLCMVSMLLFCAEENSWFSQSQKERREVTWLFYYSLHRPLFKSSKSSARSVSYLFVDDTAIAKTGVKIFEHHYFCCLTAWLFAKGLLIVGLYHNNNGCTGVSEGCPVSPYRGSKGDVAPQCFGVHEIHKPHQGPQETWCCWCVICHHSYLPYEEGENQHEDFANLK